jgi:hypothetical protein
MKKMILFLLLALVQNVLYAQTNLEVLVLKELNAYRKLNKLKPVKYSDTVSKASYHHTQWMSRVNFDKMKLIMEIDDESEEMDAHTETVDVPNFKELKNPEDRGKAFGIIKENVNYTLGEICSINIANSGNYFVTSQKPDDILAKDIITKFSKSPGHDAIMRLDLDNCYVGICVIIKSIIINGQENKIAYCTIYFIERY